MEKEEDVSAMNSDRQTGMPDLARQISEAQIEKGLRHRSSLAGQGGNSQDVNATIDDIRKIHGFRWILVCIALYLSAFMYGLDTTIAADVQAAVTDTFAEVSQLAWLGAGFPMGSVAIILPYGTLYTRFNMKWLYIAGIVLFQAGSALCGAAPSMNALIVGRVLAGMGGTGIYLGGLNHMSALTTRQERSTYISGIAFCWGIGAILGPVIGGAFSISSATWRWGFYINLIIGAITAPVYLFYLPAVKTTHGQSIWSRIAHLDYVGIVLSAAAWVTFTLALISAGGIWDWNDGRTVATLVVFGVLLAFYVLQQYFCIFTTPEDRSFPAHLLKSRTQILLYISTSASITTLFVTTYYLPIYFQFIGNDTALMAALRILPFILVTVAVNMVSGFMLSKAKYYMPFFLVSGTFIMLGGTLIYVYLRPGTPASYIYGFSILAAFGTGLSMQLGYPVATLTVEPRDIVNAINVQNVSQIGSTVIALVIAGQVFQSTAVHNLMSVLDGMGFSSTDIHAAVAGSQSAVFESLTGELRDRAIFAVTEAMQTAFILVIVAGCVSIVSALLMKREKLFGEIVTAA